MLHLVDDVLEEHGEGKGGVLQLIQTAVHQRLILHKHNRQPITHMAQASSHVHSANHTHGTGFIALTLSQSHACTGFITLITNVSPHQVKDKGEL